MAKRKDQTEVKVDVSQELLDVVRGLRADLAAMKAENDALRGTLDAEMQSKEALRDRVAALNPDHANTDSERMVGIRNISDNTIGIPALIAGGLTYQLHADLPGKPNPRRFAVITYAEWKQLRTQDCVAKGQVIRDDAILAGNYRPAPADRPEDMPADAEVNAIRDPKAWIESKGSDAEVLAALERVQEEESLQRIRRAVDDELRRLEHTAYPVQIPPGLRDEERLKAEAKRAKWALANLGGRYLAVDRWITSRLDDDGVDAPIGLHKIVKTIQ